MVKADGQHELQDLPVIAEYEDIFVTFGTQTTPVSQVLYRLASTEMKKLKEHVEDSSDKGFIRPGTLPWGISSLLL
ncbi:hypothetical protein YC2023_019829 [Brassica napus]